MRKSEILKEVKEQIKKLCANCQFYISEEDLKETLESFKDFQLDMIKLSYVDEVIVEVGEFNEIYITFDVILYRKLVINNRRIILGEIRHPLILTNMVG